MDCRGNLPGLTDDKALEILWVADQKACAIYQGIYKCNRGMGMSIVAALEDTIQTLTAISNEENAKKEDANEQT